MEYSGILAVIGFFVAFGILFAYFAGRPRKRPNLFKGK